MKHLTSWKMIAALAVVFLFFMLYLFPTFQADFNQIAGVKVKSLDTRLSYSANDVLALFEALGERGRDKLLVFSGFADMIYPLVYGSMFYLPLRKLTGPSGSRLRLLSYLPLATVVFDYIENVSILIMLSGFPAISETQVLIGSAATSLKWGFLGLTVASVVALLGLRLFHVVSTRRKHV